MGKHYHGGLNGKARQVHFERRASRLHARQLLDEYFDPSPAAARVSRYVPIHGRAEFLPSADGESKTATHAIVRQLVLPLSDPHTRTAQEHHGGRRPAASKPHGINVIRFPVARDPDVAELVRSAPQESASKTLQEHSSKAPQGNTSKTPAPRRHSILPMRVASRSAFSVKSFLRGCAVGSAAAAAILLVAWLALV